MLFGMMKRTRATDINDEIFVPAVKSLHHRRSVEIRVKVDLANKRCLTFFWTENILSRSRTTQLSSSLGCQPHTQSSALTLRNNKTELVISINTLVINNLLYLLSVIHVHPSFML